MNLYTYDDDQHAIVDESGEVYMQFPEDIPDWVACQIVDVINDELLTAIEREIHADEVSLVNRMMIRFPESEISEN